ncbi:hypothetical protein L0F81_22360 [Streptomyces tricolor]|uniref:Type IV secretion system protein n=1 Tax=Streptomyces tricolor TaxID=68277 RepID=A0ABS9JKB1_9ACTN|nr:hypothetical protein [Streptomyces tricolor]MCG0066006.1 hypothetical protein [Streptomyces tricolor]
MRADHRHPLARLVVLLAALLCCVGSGLSTAPAAVAADAPKYHLDYGPKDGKVCPPDFSDACGVDKQGNYCDYYAINDDVLCRPPEVGEFPGTLGECEDPDGSASAECSDKEVRAAEKKKLEKWRKRAVEAVQRGDLSREAYDKYNAFLTKCVVDDKGMFSDCQTLAVNKYGDLDAGLTKWVGRKISELARDALEEAAQYIGNAVVWLLRQFADLFTKTSVINLDATGISEPLGIATALSAVLAVFLLLLQFGKVAVSHQGGPAATALSGLAKWAVISSAYWTVTTTALQLSDSLSNWIIKYSFDGGSKGTPSDAMKAQFGKMFSGLIFGGGGASTAGGALITGDGVAASAVGVVIVIGIVCILAIGALWIEMILRQAGIMILVSTMPIVLVGQMSDATKDWWPKARDALLALILMKPMITFCFAIGFFAIEQGQGVQNMIVGLVIFLMACFCWPAIAKFMTFSSVGAGAAMAGGLISSLGNSATAMNGPGTVGGAAYTRALEQDNAQTMTSTMRQSSTTSTPATGTTGATSGKPKGFGGRLAARVRGPLGLGLQVMAAGGGRPLGLGLQVMAAGKDVLDSGMTNTAAHAGLSGPAQASPHTVIPPRRAPAKTPPPPVERDVPRDAAPTPKEG